MAATAFVCHPERWANALSPRARALAEIERRDAEIARLRERLRLVSARLAKVPPRRRPHYSPRDRLAILELGAAEGWSIARTARESHVAHVDLTVVPTALGGFWSSVTGTLPTVFQFCYWLVVLQGHFSRRIQGFELFKKEPASAMIRAFLDRAFEAMGAVPKHIILDRGRQFDCEAFRAWCRGHGVRWRYGAAGKKGSTAVIERLIRTIKTECTRAIRASRKSSMCPNIDNCPS
jgi:transposase InsO family protein